LIAAEEELHVKRLRSNGTGAWLSEDIIIRYDPFRRRQASAASSFFERGRQGELKKIESKGVSRKARKGRKERQFRKTKNVISFGFKIRK